MEIDERIAALIDEVGAQADADLVRDIFVTGVKLAVGEVDRLDLKIVSAALREMRAAFTAFAPYRGRSKVTIFGSARTGADDPLYGLARDLASQMADEGWMVVTGAGPGIMLAAMEGAGRANSFGVRIRLPFESGANKVIAGDEKLVTMKYFFTRKLMLMKESSAFVSLPGGFGTLDEMFELLTLQQTGKAEPAPLVLLDVPGGSFWTGWRRFVHDEVARFGYVSPGDIELASITDSVKVARKTIRGFYLNYHSIRWVGKYLVIRMQRGPSRQQLADLQARFAAMCIGDSCFEITRALPAEVSDGDELDLARIKVRLDPMQVGRLQELIGELNRY